jgi:hypothetical protein
MARPPSAKALASAARRSPGPIDLLGVRYLFAGKKTYGEFMGLMGILICSPIG